MDVVPLDQVQAIKSALASNDLDAAIRLSRKVLNRKPNAQEVLSLYGLALLKKGNFGEAIQRFRRCTQLTPHDFSVFENLGLALAEVGNLDEALSVLKHSAELGNPSPRLYANIGSLALQRGENAEAVDWLARAVHGLPNDHESLLQLGVAYARNGEWAKARLCTQKVVADRPTWSRGHDFDGFIHLVPPDFDHAIGAFRQALALPVNSPVDALKIKEMLSDTVMCRDLFPAARAHHGEVTGSASTAAARAGAMRALDEWLRSQIGPVSPGIRASSSTSAQAVFFHVDAGATHPFFEVAEAKAAPVDYRETLSMSAAWFQATQPGGRVILLTDETTPVDGLPHLSAVVRLPLSADQMMYARMRANHALLASGKVHGPMLLLDTDVCLTRDFAPLFDGGFDIGLTYRQPPDFAHMPVNEGVILVADGAAPASARFFEICLSWYDWLAEQPAVKARYGFDIRHWRGGQLSLAAFVDWAVPPYAPQDVLIDGIRVRFFPCDLYNYAVRKADSFSFLDAKWALHFKGAGPKKLMADYRRHRAKLFKA
ncbi:MAG: tetratricopeptide repeat protein [Rhodospirillaceae bacterium]|nr:tetratricopeptide repeat protein [Rhodospirillaceae bacterium]